MRSVLLLGMAIIFGVALAPRVLAQATAEGALVDVGGHKLNLRCVGAPGKGPTVILEAGGGGSLRGWSKVQELLAPRVRSCAYDRAGLGRSEPGPGPRTMRQEVFELHLLLEAAKIPPPYVLVGQSIGGLLVRLYTERYGDDVVGVVLVDPTHESAVLGSLRYGGWVRLREKATARPIPEPRRDGPPSTGNNPDDYLAEELQQIFLTRKSNPQSLGSRPLIVLAAGKGAAPPGTSEELWAQLKVEKDGQKIDLSRLSSNSRFILDAASGHNIEIDNPQLVARSIEEVLNSLSSGSHLAP